MIRLISLLDKSPFSWQQEARPHLWCRTASSSSSEGCPQAWVGAARPETAWENVSSEEEIPLLSFLGCHHAPPSSSLWPRLPWSQWVMLADWAGRALPWCHGSIASLSAATREGWTRTWTLVLFFAWRPKGEKQEKTTLYLLPICFRTLLILKYFLRYIWCLEQRLDIPVPHPHRCLLSLSSLNGCILDTPSSLATLHLQLHQNSSPEQESTSSEWVKVIGSTSKSDKVRNKAMIYHLQNKSFIEGFRQLG